MQSLSIIEPRLASRNVYCSHKVSLSQEAKIILTVAIATIQANLTPCQFHENTTPMKMLQSFSIITPKWYPADHKTCIALPQSPLSQEAKTILGMDPGERTPDQLHTALLAMQTAVEAFSEFPINMQNSLIRVGWYEQ